MRTIATDEITTDLSDMEPGVVVLTASEDGNVVLVVRMTPEGYNRFMQAAARTALALFAEQVDLALIGDQSQPFDDT